MELSAQNILHPRFKELNNVTNSFRSSYSIVKQYFICRFSLRMKKLIINLVQLQCVNMEEIEKSLPIFFEISYELQFGATGLNKLSFITILPKR